nr:hypothetical protein [Tanacetum cinerariifolium]
NSSNDPLLEEADLFLSDDSIPPGIENVIDDPEGDERLINLMKNDILNNSINDPLLEEVDLFLSDDSIPPGIENIADDPEGDIRFLEELLIDDSIFLMSHLILILRITRQFHDLLQNRLLQKLMQEKKL